MRIRNYLLAMLLAISALFHSAFAAEVSLPYKDLKLNADLSLAPGKTLADGVILITHGSLAHRDMEMLVTLRNLLRDKAYNTLAINLSLGVDKRHGMYDCNTTHRHTNDDAVAEIGAWMGWLKRQGANRVILLGHSRGGAQTALYAAEHDSPALQAVVLLAPAMLKNVDAESYQQRYNKPLKPILERARKLVKQGKGNTVLVNTDMIICPKSKVTATSFLSYYEQDPRLDTPSLLPKIRKPTLVIVAGSDEVVTGLDQAVAPLADGKNLHMQVLPGADHFFRDLHAEDAADAISVFLKAHAF